MTSASWTAVKIFSTTLARDREQLGERITGWLRTHPELTPVEVVVRQSSDSAFHCLTITLFFSGDPTEMLDYQPPDAGRVVAPRPVVPRPIR
jgi:hypothetical protein